MLCYNCGAKLKKGRRCPECGADVRLYKKIMYASELYYNEGLEKAQVRNLSGAVDSLNKSLSLNKNNINARNLLGLVYFEMGETVSAISEWVISKNLGGRDNLADKYLKDIQTNPAKLDVINQTIKKYNQALAYCRQDSKDLALIQLKKVISLNPKLIKAHQLMALLYMEEGQYDKAKKALRAAAKVDANNTLTLRYLKEVNTRLRESGGKKKKKDDILTYQSGNETIIMPATFTETSTVQTIINVVIGIVIGILVCMYLIVPNSQSKDIAAVNETLKEVNDTLADKDTKISSLEKTITELEATIDTANQNIEQSDETIQSYIGLIQAYHLYAMEDVEGAANIMANINADDFTSDIKSQYTDFFEKVSAEYTVISYDTGMASYNRGDYQAAIERLSFVVQADDTYENGNGIYYLAQAYRHAGDMENAVIYFKMMIENYPGTQRANTSKTIVDQYEATVDGQTQNTEDANEAAAEAEARAQQQAGEAGQ